MEAENPLVVELTPEMAVQKLIDSPGFKADELVPLLFSVKTINDIPRPSRENILQRIEGANTISPSLKPVLYQVIAGELKPKSDSLEPLEKERIIELAKQGNVSANAKKIFDVTEAFLHYPEMFPWPKTDYQIAVSALGCELLGHLSTHQVKEPDQKFVRHLIIYLATIHELLVGARTNHGVFALFPEEMKPFMLDCTRMVFLVENEEELKKAHLELLISDGKVSPIYPIPSGGIFTTQI